MIDYTFFTHFIMISWNPCPRPNNANLMPKLLARTLSKLGFFPFDAFDCTSLLYTSDILSPK